MTPARDRGLTNLEYIVLGLISFAPQTGYSIVSQFESETSSWSASPGSVYPMLKRLEKADIIEGELEIAYETRPRKVYKLTPQGEALLDDWLRELPKLMPFYQEREIAMWRFLFMENRLPREEVLHWLRDYLEVLNTSASATRYHESVLAEIQQMETPSLHRELVVQASIMEFNALRMWLEMAIQRLEA